MLKGYSCPLAFFGCQAFVHTHPMNDAVIDVGSMTSVQTVVILDIWRLVWVKWPLLVIRRQ